MNHTCVTFGTRKRERERVGVSKVLQVYIAQVLPVIAVKEVLQIYEKWILGYKFNITNSKLVVLYFNCSQNNI